MNRFQVFSLIALLVVVVAVPMYALQEPQRMDRALAAMRRQFVADGSTLYVENCANCHGAEGQGFGAMPALNNPNLVNADYDLLYQTIAHAPHGTIMSAWHIDEGGPLSSYEVEGLVTLLMAADWSQVAQLAVAEGFAAPTPSIPEDELAVMEGAGTNPHECRACHEEPALHAGQFGLNCSRCHTLDAWTPALLTRHTFLLDHGENGQVACQTCHTVNYQENSCYACHDHDPEDMRTVHLEEDISDLEGCVECHPTGASGEAASLGYGRSAQAQRETGVATNARNSTVESAMLGTEPAAQSAAKDPENGASRVDGANDAAGTEGPAQPPSVDPVEGSRDQEPANQAGEAHPSQSRGTGRSNGR